MYIDETSHFHPVVHTPSLWSTIATLYDAVDSLEPVDLGVLVLLLAICGSVTYAWTPRDAETTRLFTNSQEANAQANSWVKAALDVADHAERLMYASMESIQGTVILFFVTCNIEGICRRSRYLISRAITMARELSMHRIDYVNSSGRSAAANMSDAKAEMVRRVWWYLVATDW